MEEYKDIIGWIIGVIFVNISALILSIITWIKSARMMPKEIKGADLNNISKEVSIADQFDSLATKAAEKTLRLQERLDKLETDYECLEEKVDSQADVITEQAKIIKQQGEKIEAQEKRIQEQDEEIAELRCELQNSRKYNDALIRQMREMNILPVEEKDIKEIIDCKKGRRKREISKDIE